MKICFPDHERQRIFCNGAKLKSEYGNELAPLIQCLLDALHATPHLGLVPCDSLFDLRPEKSIGRNGYSIRLTDDHRIRFTAVDTSRGKVTPLADISHIQILGVDPHSTEKA